MLQREDICRYPVKAARCRTERLTRQCSCVLVRGHSVVLFVLLGCALTSAFRCPALPMPVGVLGIARASRGASPSDALACPAASPPSRLAAMALVRREGLPNALGGGTARGLQMSRQPRHESHELRNPMAGQDRIRAVGKLRAKWVYPTPKVTTVRIHPRVWIARLHYAARKQIKRGNYEVMHASLVCVHNARAKKNTHTYTHTHTRVSRRSRGCCTGKLCFLPTFNTRAPSSCGHCWSSVPGAYRWHERCFTLAVASIRRMTPCTALAVRFDLKRFPTCINTLFSLLPGLRLPRVHGCKPRDVCFQCACECVLTNLMLN